MGFYPDDWSGDYPARDAARAHEAVDDRPTTFYMMTTIDTLAIELDRLLGEKGHPEGCHCSACFALRSYNAEKMFGKGSIPSDGSKIVCQGTPFNDIGDGIGG